MEIQSEVGLAVETKELREKVLAELKQEHPEKSAAALFGNGEDEKRKSRDAKDTK